LWIVPVFKQGTEMASETNLGGASPEERPLVRRGADAAAGSAENTSWTGKLFALLGALVSLAYLANMGAGVFEFSPDVVPGVGNVDEVLFSFVLIYCLQRLGINLPFLRGWTRPGGTAKDR
jgi:hypothetical protein